MNNPTFEQLGAVVNKLVIDFPERTFSIKNTYIDYGANWMSPMILVNSTFTNMEYQLIVPRALNEIAKGTFDYEEWLERIIGGTTYSDGKAYQQTVRESLLDERHEVLTKGQ